VRVRGSNQNRGHRLLTCSSSVKILDDSEHLLGSAGIDEIDGRSPPSIGWLAYNHRRVWSGV